MTSNLLSQAECVFGDGAGRLFTSSHKRGNVSNNYQPFKIPRTPLHFRDSAQTNTRLTPINYDLQYNNSPLSDEVLSQHLELSDDDDESACDGIACGSCGCSVLGDSLDSLDLDINRNSSNFLKSHTNSHSPFPISRNSSSMLHDSISPSNMPDHQQQQNILSNRFQRRRPPPLMNLRSGSCSSLSSTLSSPSSSLSNLNQTIDTTPPMVGRIVTPLLNTATNPLGLEAEIMLRNQTLKSMQNGPAMEEEEEEQFETLCEDNCENRNVHIIENISKIEPSTSRGVQQLSPIKASKSFDGSFSSSYNLNSNASFGQPTPLFYNVTTTNKFGQLKELFKSDKVTSNPLTNHLKQEEDEEEDLVEDQDISKSRIFKPLPKPVSFMDPKMPLPFSMSTLISNHHPSSSSSSSLSTTTNDFFTHLKQLSRPNENDNGMSIETSSASSLMSALPALADHLTNPRPLNPVAAALDDDDDEGFKKKNEIQSLGEHNRDENDYFIDDDDDDDDGLFKTRRNNPLKTLKVDHDYQTQMFVEDDDDDEEEEDGGLISSHSPSTHMPFFSDPTISFTQFSHLNKQSFSTGFSS